MEDLLKLLDRIDAGVAALERIALALEQLLTDEEQGKREMARALAALTTE